MQMMVIEFARNVLGYEDANSREMDEKTEHNVYCYILEDEKREKFNLDYIYHKLGISEEDAKELREREMSFQKMVTGKRMALGEIREAIGNEVYTVDA